MLIVRYLFNFFYGLYTALWVTDAYITYKVLQMDNFAELNPIMGNLYGYFGIGAIFYCLVLIIIPVYIALILRMEKKSPVRALVISILAFSLEFFVLFRNINLIFGAL